MDLSTTYLGMELPHPLVVGAAASLGGNLDTVRKLEDAGAAAIVMPSLFEEEIIQEELARHEAVDGVTESFAEALSYLPRPRARPAEQVEQVRRVKEAVGIPVIASLNGITRSGWLDYAVMLQEAGADALELNTYHMATDPNETGEQVEQRTLEVLAAARSSVYIPVSVKLSPFYSALAHFAAKLDGAGADGLVLFNRFYQADIDIEELEVKRTVQLSDSSDLRLRLRWLAVLSGRVGCSLAATGGVHTVEDVIKAVMSGAHAVQLVSVLLKRGPAALAELLAQLRTWLEEHDYESLRQMQGSMNLSKAPDPRAYERCNYVQVLQSYRG